MHIYDGVCVENKPTDVDATKKRKKGDKWPKRSENGGGCGKKGRKAKLHLRKSFFTLLLQIN